MCLISLSACLQPYTCVDAVEVFAVAREQWAVCDGEVMAAQVCSGLLPELFSEILS